jgi:hypothetical protein
MSKLVHLAVIALMLAASSARAEPNAPHPELELAIERHFPTVERPNLQPQQSPTTRPNTPLHVPARAGSRVRVAVADTSRERVGVDSGTTRTIRTR